MTALSERGGGRGRSAGLDQPVGTGASQALSAEYSAKAAAYHQHWSPVIRPMALPVLAALPLGGARRVLDVGAGTGALFGDLQAAAPEAVIVGVDRAAGMLGRARRTRRTPVAVMDAQRLGIHDEAFDVVLAVFVLFHLPSPSAGVKEALRVLRPGGAVGVVTWGLDPGTPGLAIWREELDRDEAAPDPRDPSVTQQEAMDTQDKLERLVRDAGFSSVDVWRESFVHRWTVEALMAVQTGCGMPARRLESLPSDRRAACRARVQARMDRLTGSDLIYRPEVLFAVARRTGAAA